MSDDSAFKNPSAAEAQDILGLGDLTGAGSSWIDTLKSPPSVETGVSIKGVEFARAPISPSHGAVAGATPGAAGPPASPATPGGTRSGVLGASVAARPMTAPAGVRAGLGPATRGPVATLGALTARTPPRVALAEQAPGAALHEMRVGGAPEGTRQPPAAQGPGGEAATRLRTPWGTERGTPAATVPARQDLDADSGGASRARRGGGGGLGEPARRWVESRSEQRLLESATAAREREAHDLAARAAAGRAEADRLSDQFAQLWSKPQTWDEEGNRQRLGELPTQADDERQRARKDQAESDQAAAEAAAAEEAANAYRAEADQIESRLRKSNPSSWEKRAREEVERYYAPAAQQRRQRDELTGDRAEARAAATNDRRRDQRAAAAAGDRRGHARALALSLAAEKAEHANRESGLKIRDQRQDYLSWKAKKGAASAAELRELARLKADQSRRGNERQRMTAHEAATLRKLVHALKSLIRRLRKSKDPKKQKEADELEGILRELTPSKEPSTPAGTAPKPAAGVPPQALPEPPQETQGERIARALRRLISALVITPILRSVLQALGDLPFATVTGGLFDCPLSFGLSGDVDDPAAVATDLQGFAPLAAIFIAKPPQVPVPLDGSCPAACCQDECKPGEACRCVGEGTPRAPDGTDPTPDTGPSTPPPEPGPPGTRGRAPRPEEPETVGGHRGPECPPGLPCPPPAPRATPAPYAPPGTHEDLLDSATRAAPRPVVTTPSEPPLQRTESHEPCAHSVEDSEFLQEDLPEIPAACREPSWDDSADYDQKRRRDPCYANRGGGALPMFREVISDYGMAVDAQVANAEAFRRILGQLEQLRQLHGKAWEDFARVSRIDRECSTLRSRTRYAQLENLIEAILACVRKLTVEAVRAKVLFRKAKEKAHQLRGEYGTRAGQTAVERAFEGMGWREIAARGAFDMVVSVSLFPLVAAALGEEQPHALPTAAGANAGVLIATAEGIIRGIPAIFRGMVRLIRRGRCALAARGAPLAPEGAVPGVRPRVARTGEPRAPEVEPPAPEITPAEPAPTGGAAGKRSGEFVVARSVGAAGQRIYLPGGKEYVQDNAVFLRGRPFAGKGTGRAIDELDSLVERHGGIPENWRKMKVEANVVRESDNAVLRKELHWYEGVDYDGTLIFADVKAK